MAQNWRFPGGGGYGGGYGGWGDPNEQYPDGGWGGYGSGQERNPRYTPTPGGPPQDFAPLGPDQQKDGDPAVSDQYGYWTRPLGTGFTGATSPGTFGSFTSGQGGKGMMNALGQFNPGAQFQSPGGAVDFRDFEAPSWEQAQQRPGYQFRLQEGQRALENAASAGGMLRSGNTWKDLMKYGQEYATSEYDKEYGKALGEHQLSYQQALQTDRDRYGRALGEYQMGYGQRQDVRGDEMARAEAEATMAETGAGRDLAAQRLGYDARRSEYNDMYQRQMDEYLMGRGESRWQDEREWQRRVQWPTDQGWQAENALRG